MTKRLKIAQVITRLDPGGSSDMVVALCERLDRERFDVALVAGPSADPVERPDALAERLGIAALECPHLGREVRPVADLRALRELTAVFGKLRPDVVHVHTSKAGALGRMAAKLARGRNPVVYTPHGHLFYGYYGRAGTGLVTLAERVLAPLAKRITTLTDISRAEHLARGIGRARQFVTVPPGIDLGRFNADPCARDAMRAELGLSGRFAVGWVGRFTAVKGPGLFVEACGSVARELPNAAFVLAGDGELRGETEKRAEALGIEGVCRFLGPRRDVPAILNACDAFVLSSRNEGFGLAVAEAMACGTPVVATDVGGVREVLADGRCGRLVPPGDARALADAVLELAGNAAGRAELARAGLERAKEFDVGRMASRFAEIYEELAQ